MSQRSHGKAGFVWLALVMAAAIFGLLLLNNRGYFFQAELHETGDWASNSLFVREAKQGSLLHGHYSRWMFYHPGPLFLSTMALGEAVCYNLLRIVPTPLNGQMIGLCVAMTLFFSFALAVFARRLGRRRGGYIFFLPLALLFAIWHYGATNGAGAFMETWPACPPILTFLCFLVAVASVGSGGGIELPLLVLSGGWLVHNHVAQPLFVVPLTLLSYVGLIVSCRPRPARGPENTLRKVAGTLTAGWRAFPKSHVGAAILLALLILPLFLDALQGSGSNLSHILAHLRRHHEPTKHLLRSLCYFLTFGGYNPYSPGEAWFGRYSAVGMLAFIELHWRAYLCWITTLVAAPVLFSVSRRSAPAGAANDALEPPEATTFIPWFYATLAAAFSLTLVWGMKQDGQMFYFNAFFNYSIYYAAALGLAAGLAVFLHSLTGASGQGGARAVIAVALWLGVAASAFSSAPVFEIHDADTPADRAAARSVTEAAAATLPPGSICYLDCDPWDAWPMAVGSVLQLERLGHKARVSDNWANMFGVKRTITHDPADLSRPIVRWRILSIANDPVRLGRWPLQMAYGIEVEKLHDLDPANTRIDFALHGNFGDYAVFGWAPTGGDWTWTQERTALLDFRPLPFPADVGADVDVSISAWAYDPPGKKDEQRMEIQFEGVALGTLRLPPFQGTVQPVHVRIPAVSWQEAVARGEARLVFRFPDAKSPENSESGTDPRLLGVAFHRLQFRLADKPAPGSGL